MKNEISKPIFELKYENFSTKNLNRFFENRPKIAEYMRWRPIGHLALVSIFFRKLPAENFER